MIFFALPKPDVPYLAEFFQGLLRYLTETGRRPLVFTNYYSSMEFFAQSGATVFCPEIFVKEDMYESAAAAHAENTGTYDPVQAIQP